MKCNSTFRDENFIKLGNMIKKARTDNNMSLRELNALIGVNYATVYKIETAKIKKIDPLILARISNCLKLDFCKMMVLAGYFEVVFKIKYESNTNDKK